MSEKMDDTGMKQGRSILPITPASQIGIEKVVETLGKTSRADGPSVSVGP